MKFEHGGYARRVPPAGHFNLHWCPTADTFAIAPSFADEIQVLCPTAGTVSGFNTVNTLCLTVLRDSHELSDLAGTTSERAWSPPFVAGAAWSGIGLRVPATAVH